MRTLITLSVVLSPLGCVQSGTAQRDSEVPFKSLTHASCQLLIDGWTQDQVLTRYGSPKHKRGSGFETPRYGFPKSLPACDEQWIYPMELGHRLVFLNRGKVVLAIEEWTDW